MKNTGKPVIVQFPSNKRYQLPAQVICLIVVFDYITISSTELLHVHETK